MINLATILNRFGDAYSRQYSWTPEQAKAAGSIRACRTERLGSRRLICDHCGHQVTVFCSCRNRYCPGCQRHASDDWLEQQRKTLLPAPYFHLVFTLPHALNSWVMLHPEVIYHLLFRVVWETLRSFAQDPQRLNGDLGMTAVLHTWGQTLDRHVHLHCLVPAGAWCAQTKQWHAARSNYLFPVKALSRCYRGKMISELRAAVTAGKLHRLKDPRQIDQCLNQLMQTCWVVYTKACHQPSGALAYLSRYTHRTAISQSRLISVNREQVCFRWKDYRDGKQKVMKIAGVEFLRRFLQHILPDGFMRIRHYGFLSNRWRRQRVAEIREALGEGVDVEPSTAPPELPVYLCPDCYHCQRRVVDWLRPDINQRE